MNQSQTPTPAEIVSEEKPSREVSNPHSAPLFKSSFDKVYLKDSISTIKMSPDGSMIAIAYRQKVMIVSTDYQEVLSRFQIWNKVTEKLEIPQDFSWQPDESKYHTDWKLVAACQDGGIAEWLPSYGDNCERVYFSQDNQYTTCQFNTPGDTYVIAGSLPQLEIVDNASNKIVQTYDGLHNFHNKGIQTVRFFSRSKNLFLSGNLDSSVKFWDLRQPAHATHKIYGVQVMGHAVDMHTNGHLVLIGGSVTEEGIQLWDLRNTGAPLRTIPYGLNEVGEPYSVPVNTVKFVPDSDLAIVGVQDQPSCPVKCFDTRNGAQVFDFPDMIKQSGQSLDICPYAEKVIIGNCNGVIQVLDYNVSQLNQRNSSRRGEQITMVGMQSLSSFNQVPTTGGRSENIETTQIAHPQSTSIVQETADFSKRYKVSNRHIAQILEHRAAKRPYVWGSPPPTTRSHVTTPPPEQEESKEPPQLEASEPEIDQPEESEEVFEDDLEATEETPAGYSQISGAYKLDQDNAQEIISTMRSENRRQMQERVKRTEDEIMAEFMKKAELVQLVSNAEREHSSQSSLLDINDTKGFIQQIENHLLKSTFSKKHQPQIAADIEQITQELYRKERELQRLPEIKAKVKNIKKLLQEDLMADGALIQNVPHSSRANLNSRGSMSKRSIVAAASKVSTSAKRKASYSSQEANAIQYQKNMIVEYPEETDAVARNFDNFWNRPQKRKYSVPDNLYPRNSRGAAAATLDPHKFASSRRPSYLPDLNVVPESVKKRLPDSDHLAQMRKYLVNVHKNENFIHELGDDGYVPTAIRAKVNNNQPSNVEQQSFFDMLQSHHESKNQNIRKLIQQGIPEDYGASASDSSELGDFIPPLGQQQASQTITPQLNKQELLAMSPQHEQFEQAVKQGDMQTAYDLAQKAGIDLISDSLKLSLQDLSQVPSQQLKGNTYFRKYASKYTRQLNEILDKNFGPRLNARLRGKDVESYNTQILNRARERNIFRKKLPEAFNPKLDGSNEIQEMLRRNFKQVSETNKHRKGGDIQPVDPLTDQDYLRRLKQANYGRWYLSPKDFPSKVEILNSVNNQW